MSSFSAGDVLGGRYRLVSPLGRGGMGSVWRASHVELGTDVALKLMDPSIANDALALARFRREAQAAAGLRSPNIVQVLDFSVANGTPYLVMELLEGETLRERLNRGRLPATDVARLITELARGVGKAHAANVVHRDLKPENIFLAKTDDGEVVKVLDFGIAKVDPGSGAVEPLTHTGAAIGTPRYMSPEQLQGRREVDARTDLWSLGVVAFECLCGTAAFMADTFGQLVMQICVEPLPTPSRVAPVPAGFDEWFARSIERDPAKRFQSARELAEALVGVLLGGDAQSARVATADTAVAPASWTAGDERAGFLVIAATSRNRLEMRFWGLWTLALANDFRRTMGRAIELLKDRPVRVLTDATQFPPQKPEVQDILLDGRRAGAKALQLERTATVVASAVSRMQIRRLFEESHMQVEFFTSTVDAEAWLKG